MSCTAIAKCTWLISVFSVFCGTANAGPKSTASLTRGKSSAGSVCSVKRLLPPVSVSLLAAALSVTTWSGGSVRRMSISLRAPTVVLRLPASPPSVAWVRTWISRSLVVNSMSSPVLRSNTLARIGSVCRRSTMPATLCRASSSFCCGAFKTIMSSYLNLVVLVESGDFCEQGHFRLSFQGFSAGSTLWAEWPERRGSVITTSGLVSGLWMTAGLFESCPQGCALTGWRGVMAGSAFQRLFQHVQLLVQFAVFLPVAADLAHRMQHRGVVAPAEQLADLGQALLRHLLGQVHRDLARLGDAGRALLAVHVGDLDLVEVGHRLLDVLHADLPVLDAQQIFQRLARQADGDVLVAEAAVGQHLAQRAFQLAHVGAHVLGHEEGHVLGHLGALGQRLAHQDGHAHLQLGRLDGHRQARLEAAGQPGVDVHQPLGVGVAGHDDVGAQIG